MSEKRRTLDLLDRVYRAEAWHGPALLESLHGVTAVLAAKHPVTGARSIWELVEHLASWNEIVALRLAGEKPKVTPAWNFPPVTRRTPAAWKATLRRLARSQARYRTAVVKFPAAKFGRRRPGTTQVWNVLIHGQIHHQIHHAAQIAMMRRALGRPVGGA